MSIGHGGNGTAMQLAAMMFVTMADVKINLVPYRGTAPAVTDAIAGHVQLGIADPPPSMGAIGEGKLKAIAVSSKQRFPVFPDVPTFHELGLKDFELTGWFGIVAPAATPRGDRGEAQRRGGCGAQGSRSRAPHPHRRHGADADDARRAFRLSRKRDRQGGEGCACGGRQTELSEETRMQIRLLRWALSLFVLGIAAASGAGSPRADLSEQADPLRRAVPGGRRHRCGGACDPAAARKNSRPDRGDREPRRGRRRDRPRLRRQVPARWLHLRHRRRPAR